MKSIILILTLAVMISSKFLTEKNSIPKNPTLLQVSARPWLYQLSQERGTTIKSLKQIPDDVFDSIKARGFDFLWVMGVWDVGTYGYQHDRTTQSLVEGFKTLLDDYTDEDAIGSPYAITDYNCNPELCPGGDDDLVWLRKKLNGMGIKLMLDFVPNHSALDSPWMDQSQLEYYIRAPKDTQSPDPAKYYKNGVAYGNMQWSSPWTDVGQLNYWNPKLREHMTTKLLKVASLADGIRCDMAYIILNEPFSKAWETELNSWGWSRPSDEFWGPAIKTVKAQYPDTIFLAEVYGDYFKNLITEGFDYTYDKELLDKFKSGHLDNIRGWISYMTEWDDHQCRFLENHDDNRAVEAFGGSVTKSLAAALATYTLPGMRFFFQDQWYGYKNKLDVHLRRSKKEDKSTEAETLYNKLIPIIQDETFKNGEWTNLSITGSDAWRLMAWKWVNNTTGEKRLIVVDFSEVKAGGNVVLSDVSGSGSIKIKELLSDTEYERDADALRSSGLGVIIDPWSAQIFQYK